MMYAIPFMGTGQGTCYRQPLQRPRATIIECAKSLSRRCADPAAVRAVRVVDASG